MWLFNQNKSHFCERRELKTSPRLYTTWNTIIRSRVLSVVKPSISIKIWHCEKFHFIMRLKDGSFCGGCPQKMHTSEVFCERCLSTRSPWTAAWMSRLPAAVTTTCSRHLHFSRLNRNWLWHRHTDKSFLNYWRGLQCVGGDSISV